MLTQEAFIAGLQMVREAGLAAKGNDTAVLAAGRIFEKVAAGKEHEERFAKEGPQYAKQLILLAYANGAGKGTQI